MKAYEWNHKIKTELGAYEGLIYRDLYDHVDTTKGDYTISPNMKDIAAILGISKTTVCKYIHKLAKRGYLEISKKKVLSGNKNIYKLNIIFTEDEVEI